MKSRAFGTWPMFSDRPKMGTNRRAVSGASETTFPSYVLGTRLARSGRTTYLAVLTWAFTLFSSLRLLAYLPTVWAIVQSGDSSQHSLWTWFTWAGANATMAAWLYETDDRQLGRAAVVSAGNAGMCVVTLLAILAYRF